MGTFVEVQRPPAPIILPPHMTINPQLMHLAGGWFGGGTGCRAVMGVPKKGLLHQVCSSFWSSSDSQHSSHIQRHTHRHTLLFLNFFILPECLTNLSVRACQSVRSQWCVYSAACKWPVCLRGTTWVPVSLSTAHSPGWLLPRRSDKAGHILTPVWPCSLLSRLSAVQDAAAVLKCCGSVTMDWSGRGRRITRLTTRLFNPELIQPAKKRLRHHLGN